MPDTTFRGRVARGRYRALPAGGWILDGVPVTWKAVVLGAAVSCGEGAVASHATSLRLHGLAPWGAPRVVELTMPHRRRQVARTGAVIHRSRRLPDDSITRVDDIPATSVARALRDVAAGMSDHRLRNLVIDAQQQGLVDVPALVVESERRTTTAGAARFSRVVRTRLRNTSDSGFEVEVRRVVRAAGWAVSDGPVAFEVEPGVVLHADLALEDHAVVIECDGYGYHRDRIAFARDRRRWDQFQNAGLEVACITYDLLDVPTEIVGRVERAVRRTRSDHAFRAVRQPRIPPTT